MSEQLFYLEDKISDIIDDYLEILKNEYNGILDDKHLTKEKILKSIDISKHLKCDVPSGIPFFEIVSICDEDTNSLAIECHCCNEAIYTISTVK